MFYTTIQKPAENVTELDYLLLDGKLYRININGFYTYEKRYLSIIRHDYEHKITFDNHQLLKVLNHDSINKFKN